MPPACLTPARPDPTRRASRPSGRWLWSAWLGLLSLSGCQLPSPTPPDAHQAWIQEREAEIGGPEGWATLVGLHWLTPGTQSIGTHPSASIQLPTNAAPASVGTLTWSQGTVSFQAAPGADVRLRGEPLAQRVLQTDAEGHPDRLTAGRLTFWILDRGDRRAVRVRDPEAPARRQFRGIPRAPYDPRWRLPARIEPAPPGTRLEVPDVTGGRSSLPVAGTLVFQWAGQEHRLLALEDVEAGDWWVLFRDLTSGRTTYGSGRYLHVPRADAAGNTTLDFNRAYNPPCAFTPFATCPLPPRVNGLQLAVPVGEQLPPPHP